MMCRSLGGGREGAWTGTPVVKTLALDRGADMLRVHDVKGATEAVQIYAALKGLKPSEG